MLNRPPYDLENGRLYKKCSSHSLEKFEKPVGSSKSQLAQVDEKVKLTSAKSVTHFSNSESTKRQEQHVDHASTFGFLSILLIEILNDPQSTPFADQGRHVPGHKSNF